MYVSSTLTLYYSLTLDFIKAHKAITVLKAACQHTGNVGSTYCQLFRRSRRPRLLKREEALTCSPHLAFEH